MKRNVFIVVFIIFSIFLMNHVLSNGRLTGIAELIQTNYDFGWHQINDLYFRIAFYVYFLMFLMYNKARIGQKKVILLIVPITTMCSILLLQISFTGLFRYIYWSILSFDCYIYDILLYTTGVITLLLSFKLIIKSNRLSAFLCIIALNTVLLYFTYLAYNDILASQTV